MWVRPLLYCSRQGGYNDKENPDLIAYEGQQFLRSEVTKAIPV